MEYGLVLAGGGVRGAYQIGVWKALKELKIKVSAVSGDAPLFRAPPVMSPRKMFFICVNK